MIELRKRFIFNHISYHSVEIHTKEIIAPDIFSTNKKENHRIFFRKIREFELKNRQNYYRLCLKKLLMRTNHLSP